MGRMAEVVTRMQAKAFIACTSEDGATAIEYALIAGGVALAIASTVYILGGTVLGLYEGVANADIWK